jgi:hypothetical protein
MLNCFAQEYHLFISTSSRRRKKIARRATGASGGAELKKI